MAEALTGEAIEQLDAWYAEGAEPREMADGTWLHVLADRHPHPIAEGELIQILGRVRGADRTEKNPVDVLMMVNTVVPVPVDRVIGADDLAPSVVDRMLAAGGVALMNAADAAECYPRLWATPEGARSAWKRGTPVHSLIGNHLSGDEPEKARLNRVRYQRSGRGQRIAEAWTDPEMIPAPRGWLEERLGPLVMFDGGG